MADNDDGCKTVLGSRTLITADTLRWMLTFGLALLVFAMGSMLRASHSVTRDEADQRYVLQSLYDQRCLDLKAADDRMDRKLDAIYALLLEQSKARAKETHVTPTPTGSVNIATRR